MGFKHTLKKLMGQSVTDGSGAAGNVHAAPDSAVEPKSVLSGAAPDSSGKDEDQTTKSRQVGSKWEHKHDDLDWHSMSIPHPFPSKVQAEKKVPDEPATQLKDPKHQPATPLIASKPQLSDQGLDKDKSIPKQDILCKFVVQHGQRIGETISIDGGHIVFKHGAENLYIPMSSISGFTDEDVEIGDFNREIALKLGEEWHQRTTNSLKFDENGMLIND